MKIKPCCIFLLVIFCIYSLNALAQSNETAPASALKLDHLVKLELGLHGAGLSYEWPLLNRLSLDISIGLGGGYFIANNDDYKFNSHFIINDPAGYLKSEFKYLYNRNRRLSKAKQIQNNAGNYIAFQTKYTTRRLFRDSGWDQSIVTLNRCLLNEIHWGMQRPLGNKFLYNFHLGLGYASDFDFDSKGFYPAAGLKFSFILDKFKM